MTQKPIREVRTPSAYAINHTHVIRYERFFHLFVHRFPTSHTRLTGSQICPLVNAGIAVPLPFALAGRLGAIGSAPHL